MIRQGQCDGPATFVPAVGGLLNATLGNLTELVIALTALGAGQYMLVEATIVGAIVTNALFMLGASFFLDGLSTMWRTTIVPMPACGQAGSCWSRSP